MYFVYGMKQPDGEKSLEKLILYFIRNLPKYLFIELDQIKCMPLCISIRLVAITPLMISKKYCSACQWSTLNILKIFTF